ncbi:hypothetical protein FQR65_LT18426 [Abscondita terminalis]|nr:hypothetical protein FQR65_LT18426 [Abscondita terminalis]
MKYINQNSKPLSEVNFQNEFSKNDEGFLNSIEIKEYTLQYKNIKSRLEKYKEEGIKKSDNITIEGKKLIEDKYNEKVEKLNHIVDLLKWGSEFKLEKINFDLLINLKSDDSIILNMANDFEEPVIKFDNVSELKQYTNTDSEPEIDMILNKNNIFEGNFQLDNEAKIEKNILEFEKENQTIFEIKKTLQETTEELNNIKLQKKLISNNSEIKDDLNLVEKFEKLDEIVNKVVVQNNSSKTKDKEPKDILKINIDLKAPLVEKLDKLEEIMNNVRNGNNLQSNLEKEENRVTLYNLILQIFIQNIKELEEVYKKQTNENIVSTFKNLSKHLAKISEYDIQTALERLNVEIMDLYVEIHNILSKGLKESDKSELELKFIQNITEFRYLLGYLSTIMIQNALELKLIPDEVAKTLEGFDE